LGNNTRRFSTSRDCYQEVVVLLLLGLTIAVYRYLEVEKSLDTWKLFNFRASLTKNHQFLGNVALKSNNLQPTGNNSRKLTKRLKCWVNFQVTVPGNCEPPSIVTQMLNNFWVTLPGNCSIIGYHGFGYP